jgi:hypothetical protein
VEWERKDVRCVLESLMQAKGFSDRDSYSPDWPIFEGGRLASLFYFVPRMV